MLHLLSNAATHVGRAPSSLRAKPNTSKPALVSEQEAMFNTAAAALLPSATTHRHWRATHLIAAIGHIHIGLPGPWADHPHREASYFESARMSRQMDHL
jgi:hypothetical protein